jgi:hypothetical protein
MKRQDIVVPVTPCHVMIGLVTLILSADTKLLAKKWTRVGTVASGCLRGIFKEDTDDYRKFL